MRHKHYLVAVRVLFCDGPGVRDCRPGDGPPISIPFPSGRQIAPKVRAFIDFVAAPQAPVLGYWGVALSGAAARKVSKVSD
jgi:hypothetical protein